MPDVPDDPVVREVLRSGEFDSALRSSTQFTAVAGIAGFLLGRYAGISESGALWMADTILAARTAASALAALSPGEQLPLSSIPVIPGIGGPSISTGRVAAIAHDIWDNGPDEPLGGFDYSAQFASEPTIDKMLEFSALARGEDSVPGAQGREGDPARTVIYAVYRAY